MPDAALSGLRLPLISKLLPPAVGARHVPRAAIIDRMIGAAAVRLVLVRASAGFGKTTVMAQCRIQLEQSGSRAAWLRLDEGDNDPARFLANLKAALLPLLPGKDPDPGARSQHAIGEIALGLLDRIASLRIPFVLFLDDFEAIHAPAVLAVVDQLLESLPPGGRLVIGARERPALRLGRLRGSGELLELGSQDLRFSLDETRHFFGHARPGALDREALELIHRRTEGWPVALWLARLALERRDDREAFIARFSGSDAGLAEYLADEVLSRQSGPVRELLLRTSILRDVSAPLCEALMPGAGAAGMLERLVSANAFLSPIEGRPGCWRYHSLFASFLRSQLERDFAALLPDLHRAAARAYAAQERIVPAIDHWIEAGDHAQAVLLLRPEAAQLLKQGRFRLLVRWLDALGPQAYRHSSTLSLCHVWAVFFTRGPEAASALMQRIGIADSGRARVRAHVSALRVSLLSLLDRWEEGYAVAERSMHELPTISRYADAALINAAASAATVLGRFDDARRCLDIARLTQGRGASAFHQMYSEAIEGTIDLLEGRMRHARARLRLAMQATRSGQLDVSDSNAWAGLLYAQSVYEANELRQAARLLQVYLPLARDAWLPDHTLLGYVMLSRIAFSEGEVDHAFETLTELEYLGHERRLGRLTAGARLERSRLLVMQGYCEAAKVELERADDAAVWASVAARRHLAHDCEDLATGRARLALALGDPDAVKAMLKEPIAQAQAGGRRRRAMKLRLLLAAARARSGNERGARSELMQVLRWASVEGAVRTIADEGVLVADMVMRVDERAGSRTDPIVAGFLQQLREALAPRTPATAAVTGAKTPALSEPLTRSEVRILELLAEGHSNRELSDRLFVSDSTVRTHLRNINRKLGTTSRTEAVARARRLGAIDFH